MKKVDMKVLDIVAGVLLIIGALNWGLVGLLNFDLVAAIFGQAGALSRIIYIIVGIAGVYEIAMLKAMGSRWDIHFRKPAHA